MKTLFRLLMTVGLAVCAASGARAQPAPIKPGLWQIRMQQDNPEMSAKMREMQEQMKNMPPEQRAQVEAMMKQRGMSFGSPGEIKVCRTKEQIERNGWQGEHADASCKTDTSRSGNTWKFHSVCPAPRASETDGEATITSPEAYSVKSTTTTTEGGQPKTTKMSATMTWLGADCGDVRPAGAMRPPR